MILEKLMKRGNDPTGYGHYGAKRGARKHRGLDLLAQPLTPVFTPIDGFVTKIGTAYKSTDKFKYVDITGEVYRWRLMYCSPGVRKGQRINAGDFIGSVQNISKYHGGVMLNHLHVECYKHGLLTDPEPLLFNPFTDEKFNISNCDVFDADVLPHN